MKVWILFACDGDDEFVDTVFWFEKDAEAAKEKREADGSGMSYRVDWFEVK